jgi:hypothetical protein
MQIFDLKNLWSSGHGIIIPNNSFFILEFSLFFAMGSISFSHSFTLFSMFDECFYQNVIKWMNFVFRFIHGFVGNSLATKWIVDLKKDNTFIIRFSTTRPGCLVITCMSLSLSLHQPNSITNESDQYQLIFFSLIFGVIHLFAKWFEGFHNTKPTHLLVQVDKQGFVLGNMKCTSFSHSLIPTLFIINTQLSKEA